MASKTRRLRPAAAAVAALALLAGCKIGGGGDSASTVFGARPTPTAEVQTAGYNPDQIWAAVARNADSTEYRLVVLAGTSERGSVRSSEYLERPFFTADGKFAVAHTHLANDAIVDAGDLAVVEVATGTGRIVSCGGCHTAVAYEGSKVAFVSDLQSFPKLQVIDLAASGAERVDLPGPESAAWMPGGAMTIAGRDRTVIVFRYRTESGVDGRGDLIRPDGATTAITFGSDFGPLPGAWSPDGRQIALPNAYSCEGDAPIGPQVALLDATSGEVTTLPNPAGTEPGVIDVAWSPDGELYATFMRVACDFGGSPPTLWHWDGQQWMEVSGSAAFAWRVLDGRSALGGLADPENDFGRRVILRGDSGDQPTLPNLVSFAVPDLTAPVPGLSLTDFAGAGSGDGGGSDTGGADCDETILRAAKTSDGGVPLKAPAGSGTGYFYDGFGLFSCGPTYAVFEASRSSGSVLTYWLTEVVDGHWVIRAVNTVRVSDYETTHALFSCDQLDAAGVDQTAASADVRSRYTEHDLCDATEPAIPDWLAEVKRAQASSADDALAWLKRIAAEDADDLAAIPEGTWVPQVSGKCAPLTHADLIDSQGAGRWDGREESYSSGIGNGQILGFHLTSRHDYDGVLLTTQEALTGEVGTQGDCAGEILWISLVASQRFDSAEAALSWCDDQRMPLRECGARQLSHTGGSSYQSREG